jgi:hypothetical protein
MSKVTQFPKTPSAKPDKLSGPQAEKIAEAITTLFATLEASDQHVLLDRLNKDVRIIPASRAGDVLGMVARIIPKKPDWTAEEIRSEVAAAGVQATPRDVFNAIGYLARKGHIQRLGGGRYLIGGIGYQAQLDFEGHDE